MKTNLKLVFAVAVATAGGFYAHNLRATAPAIPGDLRDAVAGGAVDTLKGVSDAAVPAVPAASPGFEADGACAAMPSTRELFSELVGAVQYASAANLFTAEALLLPSSSKYDANRADYFSRAMRALHGLKANLEAARRHLGALPRGGATLADAYSLGSATEMVAVIRDAQMSHLSGLLSEARAGLLREDRAAGLFKNDHTETLNGLRRIEDEITAVRTDANGLISDCNNTQKFLLKRRGN